MSFIKLGQWRALAGSEIGRRQTWWNMKCKQMFETERSEADVTCSAPHLLCVVKKCRKQKNLILRAWTFNQSRFKHTSSSWHVPRNQPGEVFKVFNVKISLSGRNCFRRRRENCEVRNVTALFLLYVAHLRSQRARLSDVHLASFQLHLNRLFSCCKLAQSRVRTRSVR